MQTADLLSTLGKLVSSQKPLISSISDTPPALAGKFEAGQKLQALVQSEVSPGTFRVRVADFSLQMRLPQNIRSGDNITLQVVASQPKLIFSLSASSNPLSTPDQLSSAARLFSALAQQQPEKALVRAPLDKPLWSEAQPPATTQIAARLQEAIGSSGLFYESHQAQWLEGGRSTVQLLSEPQNQPLPNQPSPPSEAANRPVGNTATPGLLAAVPEHLQPLVQQQINALDTHQIAWQGQAWPGQDVQWEIHDESSGNPDTADSTRTWSTEIRLDLPNLGEVSATFRFTNGSLSLSLAATEPGTRELLGRNCSRLGASMSERGIPLASTLVVQHES